MKKQLIKVITLLVFATVALSSCSVAYRQRHHHDGGHNDHHDHHYNRY